MQPNILRTLAVIVASFGLSACQITPVQHAGVAKPAIGCGEIMKPIRIEVPPPVGLVESATARAAMTLDPNDPLVREIDQMYANAAKAQPESLRRAGPGVSNSMLLLSGGSQNGAFGAGFLSAWAGARPEGLPRFRVVTGISTGALQSTFAFLNRTPRIVEEYSIEQEGELLHPYTKGGLKSRSKFKQLRAAFNLVDKGAVAELEPLRRRLRDLITPDILHAVAAEAGAPDTASARKLLVGAVEMDTGDAYIFDLTRAAQLYAGGNAAMRDCYIEALMASSSVPIAALPVFIEGRMYIDGGARFGVIADFTGAVMDLVSKSIPATDPKNLFILVNGTLEAGQTCHLRDCDDYKIPPTPAGQVAQHAAWSFEKLALRSVSILINQSYRSSVYWARTTGLQSKFTPRFVRMEPDHLTHPATLDFDVPAGETLKCEDWKKRDRDRDQPTEFHPRFMRCLIDYGGKRTEISDWVAAE